MKKDGSPTTPGTELTAESITYSLSESIIRLTRFVFHHQGDGFIEYLITGSDRRNVLRRDYLTLPFDLAEFYQSIGENISENFLSFGPAPRRRKSPKRGTDADVSEIGCIWAEFSYDRVPGGVLGVVERLSSLRLRPSLVIETVTGKLVLYVFNKPLSGTGLIEWRNLNSRLNAFAGNKKPPNPSSLVSLNISDSETGVPNGALISEPESSFIYYSRTEVEEFILNLSTSLYRYGFGSEADPPDYAPTEKDLRARKVPARVTESILKGTMPEKTGFDVDEDERARMRDAFIVRTLLEKSFTENEITSIFRNNPSGCGKHFFERRRGAGKYLLDLIKNAKKEISQKIRGASIESGMLPAGYLLDEHGAVWFESTTERAGGNESKMTFVSKSPLRITEIRENIDSGQISVVISYGYLGKTRSTVISRSQMCNTRSLVAALAGEGAPVNSNNAKQMVSYLAAYEHDFADLIPRKKTTSKFGRGSEGEKFLLPGLMADVEFEPGGAGDLSLYRAFSARKGSLASWVETMNSVARGGFMIPQIAVLASFIPPLQKPLQIPNFILDIFGNTSSGKSTTLRLAASVFGNPFDSDSLIQQWMNTKIAIEQIAGMCSELPIYLDDAQHCPSELKRNVVYMIANGKGKGRAGGHGGLKETMTWRTVALSTSEEPLYEAGTHEGVRSRILPVGGFVAPFPPNSAPLVQTLEKTVSLNHGFAGEAFIRHLNGWKNGDWAKWERRYRLLSQELALNSASDIIGRVSGYIAAVGVAGEIVCPLLGIGFKPDAVVAWLVDHLQEQQNNQNIALAALRVIADFYVSNLAAFAGTKEYRASRGKGMLGVSKNAEYVGFTRSALDKIFAKHRWNQNTILQKLSEAKMLISTEADRYTKKVTFGGAKHRLVCIKWSALLPDDATENG